MARTDPDGPPVAPSGTEVEEADVAAATALGQHRRNPAVRALGAASEVADQAPALAVCGAVLGYGLLQGDARLAEAGGRMLASVVLATAIKGLLKRVVSRARPHVLLDEGRYTFGLRGPKDGDWRSFPSGHTADAVGAARGLARVYRSASAPAYAVAAGIGAIQIPRARHYPIDVVAGAAVGMASELLVDLAVRKRVRARRSR